MLRTLQYSHLLYINSSFHWNEHQPNIISMKNLANENNIKLASATISILDSWGVSNADKIKLLALPAGTKPRAIQRYQQGLPFPDDKMVQERVGHLQGIAQALQLAYPRNAQGGELWLNRPCKKLNSRIPITIMLEDGMRGIIAIRMHVDCSYDWFVDDQASQTSHSK